MTSASPALSVGQPQESSHHDEFLMQQSLLFSDTLKDLKNLRKQLYSAAEYFELAYCKEEQKHIVEETLKDYAIKALVNTVDHLGSVAYKVNNFLDDKMGGICGMELRVSCLQQRLETCQEFVNLGGLSQQSLVSESTKHHKRYIFPVKEGLNDLTQSRLKSRPSSIKKINIVPGIEAMSAETPNSQYVRDEFFGLRSPQPLPRQRPRLFTSTSMNQRAENRSISPRRFPLPRSGSLMQRSTSPTPSHTANAKRRWPSEPRRTVSLCTNTMQLQQVGERERANAKEMEHYSSKSKRLFKAMLSLRKSKKDLSLYKFLDDNN